MLQEIGKHSSVRTFTNLILLLGNKSWRVRVRKRGRMDREEKSVHPEWSDLGRGTDVRGDVGG
jgi:hypothetical protein